MSIEQTLVANNILTQVPKGKAELSSAKKTDLRGEVISESPYGGRYEYPDGRVGHYPAVQHRRNLGEDGTIELHGPAYDTQVTECHMLLEPADPSVTADLAEENLQRYEDGEVRCCNDSMGAEIEGVVAEELDSGLTLSDLHESPEAAMADPNPELMSAMIERASGSLETGEFPATPAQFAQALAETGQQILDVTDVSNKVFVPTSVPEFGQIKNAHTNLKHPYVGSIAEYIMILNELNWDRVPDSAKEAYIQAGADLGVDLFKYLKVPFCAYHSHRGTAKLKDVHGREVMDPRSAYVRAYLLHTPAARIVENMMANTSHFYGEDLEVRDVRKVMRYILYSTHGSVQLPQNAEEWIASMEHQLKTGKVHSIGRFPESAQHSTCRMRTDKRTIESTSPPQHPDYRMLIGWSLYTKMLDPFAEEALAAARGDEALAVKMLQESHPWLFKYQSAMLRAEDGQMDFAGQVHNTPSAYEWDMSFNAGGWDACVPGMNMSFKDGLAEVQGVVVQGVAQRYPRYFDTYGKIVNHLIDSQLQSGNVAPASLAEWHGVENGVYRPNGRNVGLVTDAKRGMSPSDAARVHAEAFRLQTAALKGVRDDSDLLEFYGIAA